MPRAGGAHAAGTVYEHVHVDGHVHVDVHVHVHAHVHAHVRALRALHGCAGWRAQVADAAQLHQVAGVVEGGLAQGTAYGTSLGHTGRDGG